MAMRTAVPKTWLVRITRPNGSVTYKGPYTTQQKASYEAAAWIRIGHRAQVLDMLNDRHVTEYGNEFKTWKRWVRSVTDSQGRQSGEQFIPGVTEVKS